MSLMLFGLLAVMLVFMFLNTRKRQKQMKEQQEEKATKTVPGVKVLLQGGLYGTIVSYDPVDLDKPARVEIAPGVVIEVHSQAILRLVDETAEGDVLIDTPVTDVDAPAQDRTDGIESIKVETPEETKARLERNDEN
ncbi:preprotein translocase subunit YajC [Microbacterium sp. NPDC089987]|uniref:preprotein translocase subunit YajC n=1 Tax=Microbacterium sp. NPDC089987 TaxID=3364202 RepID=UPI003800E9C4